MVAEEFSKATAVHVVAFVSDLPGSGKTLLAGHVAVQADANGIGPVVVLDADPGQGLSGWWRDRTVEHPILGVWDQSFTPAAFEQMASAGVELVVIDTPSVHPDIQGQLLLFADLVVIPVRPNSNELKVVGSTVDRVEALGLPFVFLINHAKDDGEIPSAAVIALAQHGTICPVIVPWRADFAEAWKGGCTVMDLNPESESSGDTSRLWGYLENFMSRLPGTAAAGATEALDDRRRHPRYSYDQAATFKHEDNVFPCQIDDISACGISIWSAKPLPEGAQAVLHVPYLGEFKVRVVRCSGERIAMDFMIEEGEQAKLVEQLSGLLHANRISPNRPGQQAATG